ncbi:MAG TPA: putative quinol monooxygenase [Chloroflexota bacterium]
MHVIVAEMRIKPEYREQFMESMIGDASGSVANEPGCFQFSVIRDEKDPNHIVLFEVYRDAEAFAVHQQMPHYVKWRDTVKDWYAAPTVVTKGFNAWPGDEAWAK